MFHERGYTFTRRGYISGWDRIFVKRGYTFRVEGVFIKVRGRRRMRQQY